ncbi:uncharacterized protein N7473_013185 [Penicillium subrubescens]|uniref:uncharacterized protein n=1 Tax=Penicillium subrubescens TaxID=1316194 RepID=UPI0025454743|nr:uncharacterized protein N7473_013185 [Penicillium subrubescens]KAJ5873626.1 hypothetical protein N7473_013185 [Penicillium subrubescens]
MAYFVSEDFVSIIPGIEADIDVDHVSETFKSWPTAEKLPGTYKYSWGISSTDAGLGWIPHDRCEEFGFELVTSSALSRPRGDNNHCRLCHRSTASAGDTLCSALDRTMNS